MNKFFSKIKKIKKEVFAPVSGTAVSITEVQDEVFSKKILGDGIAIKISAEKKEMIVSPVNGKVSFVTDTLHGLGITTDDGTAIIIHIGIDTVNLNGSGFSCYIKEGQKVKIGSPLCMVDFPFIKENNYETDVLIIMPDEENSSKITQLYFGIVTAGESCIMEYE